jgi:DNA polymerase (family 10)
MPVHNEDIAQAFDEIADLLEIEQANPFRIRAYRNAARSLRGLAEDVGRLAERGEDLTQLPAIGKDLAGKIHEMLKTRHLATLDKLHETLPAGLQELLQIAGLGPKRVARLYHVLDVSNIAQLQQAIDDGRLRRLKGFGQGVEQRIRDAITLQPGGEKRFLRAAVIPQAEALVSYLQQASGVREVVVAGSFRRGRETVGDLDILVTTRRVSDVMQRFGSYDEIDKLLSSGSTRASAVLHNGLQVDLRVVSQQSYGAALYYFTGSKAHNIRVRRMARAKGLKINEYGVFRGERKVAGKTEASVFKSVGLACIPPELREARGEIEAARDDNLPRLLDRKDLRGDLHCHSRATDGQASIREMALAARQQGLQYLAITDHSRHLAMVNGLDRKRLLAQVDEIERINGEIDGITLLKGIEVDILADGSLDLPHDLLQHLDLVVAAVHSQLQLSRAKQTERILRAMDSPCFTLLAHPTGRLLLKRKAYQVDMPRIIRHAAERGCFLELNSQPQRLDIDDHYCRMARDEGVLVSINSDAHDVQQFDYLQHGIMQARRGWLCRQDVLNALPLRRLRPLLRTTMS